MDDAQAAAMREVFSDPTLKVNIALIDRLDRRRRDSADAALRAQPPKP